MNGTVEHHEVEGNEEQNEEQEADQREKVNSAMSISERTDTWK